MSTEEIKELDENLKLQTAALVSTNLMLGALISVITEEQFLKMAHRYVLDTQQHNANLMASKRPDAKEWHALMEKMQQQLFGQVMLTREQHNSSRN
ncbi:hypothetical protein [Hydrogenophaga sp. H7]|uniref:hypothetical protein n=1 Tax=Hydrogenophaga sp. H7 TaxID=1882399 RepID=UPI0009A3D6F1|nr:hypothetical protein [Hydrogenophaga sp. H7]OPF63874.1 hypothetical protein BC358_08230 [Hydrogenophaga sp. H7]